jgi:hypothetical protein
MLSPMMTVIVLAVLWLIVVVPMIFRRHDEGARDRSVARFGRSMRALGRRAHAPRESAEVYVPSARPAQPQRAVSTRRPVPAAEEALMYPVDTAEMSEARVAMMARRRRSLGMLGIGTVVLVPTALIAGGLMWLIAAPFAFGLAGYLLFLRSQAQHDRDRRYQRQQRASQRRTRGRDVTAYAEPALLAPEQAESVVRIDDEDIELQNLDTVDLTGLYSGELAEPAAQRRAS